MGRVFPMVISSEFPMRQYRDGDHREDAPHFTIYNLQTKFNATQNYFQLNEERRKLVEATRIRLQKQRERVMEYTDAKLKRN